MSGPPFMTGDGDELAAASIEPAGMQLADRGASRRTSHHETTTWADHTRKDQEAAGLTSFGMGCLTLILQAGLGEGRVVTRKCPCRKGESWL
jgi:hypothetical protein